MGHINKHLPRRLGSGAVALGAALGLVLVAPAAQAASTYYQGFEEDTSGWSQGGDYGSIDRVGSGSSGAAAASSEGEYHAIVKDTDGGADAASGPYSFFDDVAEGAWPGDYTTEIDVYLDPEWGAGSGFDYSVAAWGADGNHQRDYIFHVAKDDSGDLLIAADNGTTFAVSQNLEARDNYSVVPGSGWYTLQHHFYDDHGVLAVDMKLLEADGGIVFSETLSSDLDQMSEIGGNGYGWFTVIDVAGGLNVDAQELILEGDYPTGEITSPTAGQDVSGTLNLAATYDDNDPNDEDSVQWAVRQGNCAAGTNTVAGNVDGFNDPYMWDGAEFTAALEVSEYDSGDYCFVFNPTDDAGETNVRDTVEFTIAKVAPTAKDECKNGGWQDFATEYKNQGQCVADAQSNEHSKHHRG